MSPVRPMRMYHVDGTATTTPTKVPVDRGIGQYIAINNQDAINNLEVSFDGGQNFYPISPGDTLSVGALFHHIFVRSAGGDPASSLTAVRAATDAVLPTYTQAGSGAGATLTDDGVGILTVDGVALVVTDRVLVKDGAAGADNGIYTVTIAGTGIPATTPETAPRLATDAALPAYTQAGAGAGATLTADSVGVLTVDAVATVLNDRILVKDGATGADNGLYEVTTEGTGGVAFILTRATDHDTDAEVTSGDYAIPTAGTANIGLFFQISTLDPIVVDTTAVTWEEVFQFELTRATDHDTDAEVTSGDFVSVTVGTANADRGFVITTGDPITVDTTAVTWAELSGSYSALMGAG